MDIFEKLNSFLSGSVLPVLLIGAGVYFAVRLRFFFLVHPIKYIKDLFSASGGGGTSPFKALTVALAGTLGVGNISGVATAIASGGAGAVFWMWISAFAAMSVKYAEVALAVKYRKTRFAGGRCEHYGGAPVYIAEGLPLYIGRKSAVALSVFFSLLLVSNSLVTGNIVQVNAASSVSSEIPKIAVGIVFALLVAVVASGGMKRVGDFTSAVIPVLSVTYFLLSLYIIISNAPAVPRVFGRIFSEALSLRSCVGGAAGYGVMRAVRFGVTRGVFSNEAGCGTAPTAHAAADTKSPHHQGCFGIFEVFCDTVVLCSVTAIVILLAGESGKEAIPLVAASYGKFTGKAGEIFILASVAVFALATVICQSYYGVEALSFVTKGKRCAKTVYIMFASACAILGSVMSSSLMWQIADLQISVMTIINTLVVFVLSDEIFKTKKTKAIRVTRPHTEGLASGK